MLLYFFAGLFCLIQPHLSYEDSFYNPSVIPPSIDLQMFRAISPNNSNVMISPLSLRLVMALLYEGSNKDTQREFETVFQFDGKEKVRQEYSQALREITSSEPNPDYVFNLGTRIFLDNHIEPQQTYQEIAKTAYQTKVESTNFDDPKVAAASINSWIQKLTNDKVRELVHPDDLSKSIMVIANAIYFKGTWINPFPRNQTHWGNFYTEKLLPDKSQQTTKAEFVTTTASFYRHENPNLDATFLRLPYKGQKFSLWIILPNSKGGLQNVIDTINSRYIQDSVAYAMPTTVHLTIPKFKFSFQTDYVDALRKVGMKDLFQNTVSLPHLVKGNRTILRKLQVSAILQKTEIEIDEEGSVASSATGITIGNKFGDPVYKFNASHPFMFFLLEEDSSNVVFMGKVQNPSLGMKTVENVVPLSNEGTSS